MRTSAIAALAIPVAALVLAGCGSAQDASTSGPGPITVTATDTECTVSRTSAAAGNVEFTISNRGTKVNEFYVYAEGDRIVGEVENLGPGLTRTLHIQVSEPGTYETACKPGMVGSGIRAAFTVTAKGAAA